MSASAFGAGREVRCSKREQKTDNDCKPQALKTEIDICSTAAAILYYQNSYLPQPWRADPSTLGNVATM